MNKFNNSQNEMYIKPADPKPASENRGAQKQESAGKESWPSGVVTSNQDKPA